MGYALMEPLYTNPDGSVIGRLRKIFDTLEAGITWCSENCNDPKYEGWYLTAADGLIKAAH